jgi:TonB family protein
MMLSLLIEAALRTLLVALAVGAGLRLLRVSNVLAQKKAWCLVLAAALAMPLLTRWQWLSASALIHVPAPSWGRSANSQPAETASAPISAPAQTALPNSDLAPLPAVHSFTPDAVSSAGSVSAIPAQSKPRSMQIATLLWFFYFGVGVLLLVRLLYGLIATARLWIMAEPVCLAADSDLAAGMRLRSSRRIASPVALASGVVLPAEYLQWDRQKLRIVLAHERAHLRQGDFYLQILAGLHAALFWFSPLSWWLKRKLSDLGEAVSDRAGLEAAVSRSSYAQILLEFAALPRPALRPYQLGVAMTSHSSSLSDRIERFLDESRFHHAFAGSRRRALLAVLLVPAAIFAFTALIRVEAAAHITAVQATQTIAAQAAQPVLIAQANQTVGQATPDSSLLPPPPSQLFAMDAKGNVQLPAGIAVGLQISKVAPKYPPLAKAAHVQGTVVLDAEISKEGTVTSLHVLTGPAMLQQSALDAVRQWVFKPYLQNGQPVKVTTQLQVLFSLDTPQSADEDNHQINYGPGYSYSNSYNGDSYALVTGPSNRISYSGDWDHKTWVEIDKARKQAHGEFLWFKRNGKPYLLDDPAVVVQIKAMYMPMEALGKQQEELGRQQKELGKQMEEVGRKMREATLPTPDMSKEIDDLEKQMAKLRLMQGKTMTTEEWAEMESKLGNLQGKLGAIQGEIGARQGAFGGEMGKLGGQMGELGGQQGRLGAEQGRLAEEADRKIRAIIDKALKEGKAKPIE